MDRIAATVNDTAIPESEVRKAMLVSALQPAPGESAEAFRSRVLDALIDQQLEYQDASRFGAAPPDAAQIAEAMKKLEDRLKAEGKDPQAEFARAGLTEEDVAASLERQLVIQRYLRERFAPIAYADEEQARAEYERATCRSRRPRSARRALRPGRRGDAPPRLRSGPSTSRWRGGSRSSDRRRGSASIASRPSVQAGRTPVLVSTAPPAVRTPAP